jgi:hypothetical protein
LIKAAPAAPLARRQRRAQPWEARPAHAGPHSPGYADQRKSHGRQAGEHSRLPRRTIVPLPAAALGRPAGVAARSASPNLMPLSLSVVGALTCTFVPDSQSEPLQRPEHIRAGQSDTRGQNILQDQLRLSRIEPRPGARSLEFGACRRKTEQTMNANRHRPAALIHRRVLNSPA